LYRLRLWRRLQNPLKAPTGLVSEKIKARVTVLELASQYVDLKPTVNSTTWRFLRDRCHDEACPE
jgi:hypothetical protein